MELIHHKWMTPIVKYTRPSRDDRAWLYDFVYRGRISIFVVFLLWLAFLVQPLNQAMAAEPVVEDPAEATVAEDVQPHDAEPEAEEMIEETAESETLPTEEGVEPTTETTEVSTTEPTAEDNPVQVETDSEETASSTSDEIATSTDESTDTETSEITESTDDAEANDQTTGTSTVDEVDPVEDPIPSEPVQDEPLDETSSSTASTESSANDAQQIITEQNYYQFSRQACVAVGGGAYHCTVDENTGINEDTVVYADQGPNGNMEIYLKTSRGDVKQITDNDVEDSAPHYDPDSMQIVWQRLINGRQQIILYDIAESKEAQLTFSRTNNMEPKVARDGVVWQAWDDNDWEIIYFDGNFTTQITDNTEQDVAPVIEDAYILWTVLGQNSQEAKVYSLESGQVRTIVGHDGGTIENPRFVLVYDTKYENGDVITQGFDPLTGVSAPISSQPAPEPIHIPLSDPVGEIRALIQNKSSQEDEFDVGLDDDGGAASSTLDISQNTSSSTDTLNLKDQVPDDQDILTLGSTTPEIEEFELTEYDLVLSPVDLSQIEASEATTTTASSTQS